MAKFLELCIWCISDGPGQHVQHLLGAASNSVRCAQQVVVVEPALEAVLWVLKWLSEKGPVLEINFELN